jgi:hypothetical protein
MRRDVVNVYATRSCIRGGAGSAGARTDVVEAGDTVEGTDEELDSLEESNPGRAPVACRVDGPTADHKGSRIVVQHVPHERVGCN